MSKVCGEESSVPTAEKIVDTHFHIWDLSHPTLRYNWLAPDKQHPVLGEIELLKRSYLLEEYIAEARAVGIERGIHVQCADPLPDPVVESVWLDREAQRCGFPHAIVAYADLADPRSIDVLARQAETARVRGIRDLDSSARLRARSLISSDILSHLADFGFHYELRAVVHDPEDTEVALQLCEAHPDITVVLLHAGLPLGRSPEYLQQWRSQLGRFGRLMNVVCKFSGLGMGGYINRTVCASDPVHELFWACVEVFGPNRIMLGSNWPVDLLCCSYADLFESYRRVMAELNGAERAAIASGTATRVYGI